MRNARNTVYELFKATITEPPSEEVSTQPGGEFTAIRTAFQSEGADKDINTFKSNSGPDIFSFIDEDGSNLLHLATNLDYYAPFYTMLTHGTIYGKDTYNVPSNVEKALSAKNSAGETPVDIIYKKTDPIEFLEGFRTITIAEIQCTFHQYIVLPILHKAIAENKINIIDAILSFDRAYECLHYTDENGVTPFKRAVDSKNIDIFNAVNAFSHHNLRQEMREQYLYIAEKGTVEMLKVLLNSEVGQQLIAGMCTKGTNSQSLLFIVAGGQDKIDALMACTPDNQKNKIAERITGIQSPPKSTEITPPTTNPMTGLLPEVSTPSSQSGVLSSSSSVAFQPQEKNNIACKVFTIALTGAAVLLFLSTLLTQEKYGRDL
ncbi:MAG: hypothetical protein ACHP6I_01475 [Rickettsiales bacterium]